jgi:hypothetical protein
MLRLCTVALALMACGVVAAPAPVFRPPKAPKTLLEAILTSLRKTGRASGPNPNPRLGGSWSLTAQKLDGDRLEKITLIITNREGETWADMTADQARIGTERGTVFLELFSGYCKRLERSCVFRLMTASLYIER